MRADAAGLGSLLADDFLLIDVMRGSVIDKAALIGAIQAGQVVFDSIEPSEMRVRSYAGAAIIVGCTHMRGRFAGVPFQTASRYTHTYIEQSGRWLLASAQGTPIAAE